MSATMEGGALEGRAEDDCQRNVSLGQLAVLSSVSQTIKEGEEPAKCIAMAGARHTHHGLQSGHAGPHDELHQGGVRDLALA
jgi:hypothetical protein